MKNLKFVLALIVVGFAIYKLPFLIENPEIIGSVAAFCTTCSFIPQVVHTIKTKDTEAISLVMYLMFVFGVACWLFYGFLNKDIPLAIANGITFVLAAVILTMKVKDVIKGNGCKQEKA